MRRRKLILILGCAAALLFLLFGSASAELASNLKVRTDYNPKNRKLVEAKTYVDDDGNAVVASDKGYATIRYTYTTYNLVSKIELLDEKGKPVTGAEGYAVCTKVYTDRRLAEQSYFDAAGKPVIGPEGYSRQVTKYQNGKHKSTWRYDTAGNPIGTHQITEYEQVGQYERVSSDSWYDAENNLAAGPNGYARVEYDWSGKQKTRIAYFGEDGKPWYSTRDHYATMISKYKGGKIRETRYYDADGEPIPGPQGYAYVLYTYPEDSRLAMYYNADGSLYYLGDGTCGVKRKLGVRNRETERIYYIGEGKKGNNKDGYTRIAITYTKTGKVSKQKYYDENNKPVTVASLGYAEVTNTYQNGKTLIWTTYNDEKGKPAACKDGYEAVKRIYTDRVLTGIKYFRGDQKTPMACNAGYAEARYENDENGKPLSTKYYDADGKPCLTDQHADEVRNTWAGGNKLSESYWTEGEPVAGKNGYHRAEYEYNSKGAVMCTRFYNEDGELINAAGQEYAYVRTVLFKDMKLVGTEAAEGDSGDSDDSDDSDGGDDEDTEDSGADGEGGTENGSQDNGTVTEYYGLDGKLMNLKAGYAYIVREMNAGGKVTRETYYDRDGAETELAAGYSRIEREYDAYGNLSRESYYDRNGNRVTLDQGYHSFERENDLNGNPLRLAYFDANGEPAVNISTKYHRIERTWLDSKHAMSEAWFDAAGKPVAPSDTFVKIEREFDQRKNTVAERTYGADGEPITRNAGYDELRQEFDNRDRVIRISYYIHGESAANTDGIASLTREYDGNGCILSEAYYGADGEPAMSISKKYHRLERTWLDAKHMSGEAWFDTEENPVAPGDTYCAIVREYDERGNMTAEKTKQPDGSLIARKAGYDEMRQVFDENNRVVRISYWLDGAPFAVSGAAVIERAYDEKGCVAEEAYYGTDGTPAIHTGNKYHKIKRVWADTKHVSREEWFDTEGKPLAPNDTFVRIEREFDIQGNTISEVTYGADGAHIARKAGYDETRQEFNRKNQVIRISYWLNGEPFPLNDVAAITRSYDRQGLVAAESYYGAEGEPVIHGKNKYHRIEREWLDSKHATREAWFDTEGQPMMVGDTYVRIDRDFDKKGNTVCERTYGPDGEMIARKAGYDEIRREFNEKNQASRISYWLAGAPFTTGNGYAAHTREYDAAGNIALEKYYDGNGEPVACKSGFGGIQKKYNEKKQVIYEAWFDPAGAPMAMNRDIYYAIEREYDENGNAHVLRFLDGNGQYTVCRAGYEMVWRRFDDKKRVIYESYMDHTSSPMANANGVYQTAYDYNEAGKVTQEQYFNADGSPMETRDGAARVIRTYGEDGSLAGEERLNLNGEPV